jgi:hypothetical protein
MVEAMKHDFDRIYSIELSEELHRLGRNRFRGARHIELIQGDSSTELGRLMQRIDRPALFWLDGHYSGGVTARGKADTPIFDELNHILADATDKHVLIIDDARCFGVEPAYPTIDALERFIRSRNPSLEITVCDDSIRVTP